MRGVAGRRPGSCECPNSGTPGGGRGRWSRYSLLPPVGAAHHLGFRGRLVRAAVDKFGPPSASVDRNPAPFHVLEREPCLHLRPE